METCTICGRALTPGQACENPYCEAFRKSAISKPIEAPDKYRIRPAALSVGDKYRVEVDRNGGDKPYILISCNDDGYNFGIDPEAWPSLRAAIDEMISQCREVTE